MRPRPVYLYGQLDFRRGLAIRLDPDIERIVMSQNRAETVCSACGRYIGSWERCPFCRHFNPKRPIVRALKYGTPVLTILGLGLLSVLGGIYGTPDVMIAQLNRRANFAQVRIEGRVSDEIRFYKADPDSGTRTSSLQFEVDDGTGIIRVRCYEDAYEDLLEAGAIPGLGDWVTVVGNYQYKAKRQFMILSSPEDIEIGRDHPVRVTPIRDVLRLVQPPEDGRRLQVTGRVKAAGDAPYSYVWMLADPDGEVLTLGLSKDTLAAHGMDGADSPFWDRLQVDAFVTCSGTLERERTRDGGSWQLVPAGPDDVRVSNEAQWKTDNRGE